MFMLMNTVKEHQLQYMQCNTMSVSHVLQDKYMHYRGLTKYALMQQANKTSLSDCLLYDRGSYGGGIRG